VTVVHAARDTSHAHAVRADQGFVRVPRRIRGGRAGLSLVEVMVAMTIMTVAFGMFTSTRISSSRLRTINRDTARATDAAREALETMRNREFRNVYALFNDDPSDDPAGEGTAPGARFTVAGLVGVGGDALVGEIAFPVVDGGLREISELAELGMPRDLDGDSVINDEDRAGDYVILPVRIRVEWKGAFGPRHVTLHTMLTEFTYAR
jgi:prepilin-type N-terminal cleavage/methylation domain-containing protein